jgi:hypothetical protein
MRSRLVAALLAMLGAGAVQADTYTYSGRLEEFGVPASGRYDLKLAVHADAQHGNTIVTPIEYSGVDVVNGAFKVDFDLPTRHDDAWVELSIRPAGSADWVALPGRTEAINAPAAIGQCWSTTGDSGSNPANNFLGTTDAQPLVLRTANARSLRIEPSDISFGGPALPITTNTISGSHANDVTAGVRGATIAGGGLPSGDSDPNLALEGPNRVTDHYGSVGGGYANRAGDDAGVVSTAPFATVDGGFANVAGGLASAVGGGQANSATGVVSTVAGGTGNLASGIRSSVGGGSANAASDDASTVAGGASNLASKPRSTVAGGESNTASGDRSTVGGGSRNCAGGAYSWAGGRRAKVRPGSTSGDAGVGCMGIVESGPDGDQGTFAWADSQDADLVTSGVNQFVVRAAGGIYLGTDSAPTIPRDRFINTSTGAYLTVGGTWTNASSRSLKKDFTKVDPLGVLERLLSLPITTWTYLDSAEGVHMGPVAEEFKAAFGLAGDGTSIATVDADGVALAAIQGLNAKLEARNAALEARNDELAARITALESALLARQPR